MTTSLGLKQYGRGPYKILIPRVYSRKPRKEWIISPSLLIFLLSITTIFIVNHTLLDERLYQFPRTTIILPHTEKVPEPTVPKSLPLIKVLTAAAQKTLETPRVEMERDVPDKPVPPEPLEKPLPEKRIEALKPMSEQIQPKIIDQALPLAKSIPEKQIPFREMEARPLTPREIPNRHMPLENKIAPAPTQRVSASPSATPAPSPTPRKVTRSDFVAGAMPSIEKNVASAPARSTTVPPPAHVPEARGPKPGLSPWESAQLPPSRMASGGGGASAIPREGIPKPGQRQITRDSAAPLPKFSPAESRGSGDAEDIVIIRSRALGSSERVKILKQDIMKKARKLNPANSPYTYKVRGFTCTLAVEEIAGSRKVIIDFNPPDAPFEVVSELERTIR